jgi:putative transcriptional regulator
MSNGTTTVRVRPDRTLERKTATGWERIKIPESRSTGDPDNPAYDPDNPPRTEAQLARMKRVPRARSLRRALRLTQEEFSARYRVPIGTLRDWEQGRTEPDAPAKALLHLIASDPEWAAEKLGEMRELVSIAPQLRTDGEKLVAMGYVEAFEKLGYTINPPFSDVSAEKSDGIALAIFRKEIDWKAKIFDTALVARWEENRRNLPGNTKRIQHLRRAQNEFSGHVDVILHDQTADGTTAGAEPWVRPKSHWQLTYFDEATGHHRIELVSESSEA